MLGLESLTDNLAMVIKTLAKLQHLAKSNQRAIWYRLLRLNKLANLQRPFAVEQAIYKLENRNNYKKKLFLAKSDSFFIELCFKRQIEIKTIKKKKY